MRLTGWLAVEGVLSCLLLTAPLALFAGDWPQFRGPNASGVAVNSGKLPAEIGPEQNVLWKIELPPGHSSPIVSRNRVFVTGVKDDQQLVTIALDAASGKVLWEREAPHQTLETIHAIGSYAQPSPATDGERVVSFFGSAGLFCYDLEGNELWHKPLGPFSNTYGAAGSPILVDDLVILNLDHDIDSHLLALDKRSGEVVWKADRGEFPRGYCSPIVWEHEGGKQIIVVGALRVIGYDAKTGEEIWTVRGLARISNLTPVLGRNDILYVSEWAPGGDEGDRITAGPWTSMLAHDGDGDGKITLKELPDGPLRARFPQIDRDKDGWIVRDEYEWMESIFNSAQNATVAIRLGGRGDVTDTHVLWKEPRFVPYVSSAVYFDDALLMVKNGGIVTCFDGESGRIVKQGRAPNTGQYYSSPVVGDGKIYLINERGQLTVLTAAPRWEVLSAANFDAPTYSTPAIADGKIYLRTGESLFCFGLAE